MIETTELDGAHLVRLNRPPVNALDRELNDAITATFGSLSGPVVLTGTGRCFSAGVDLPAILAGGSDDTGRYLESLVSGFLAVFDYPGPVVAAVNGHALAGGCVLAMAADVRFMAGGTIGITEIAVGVPFPVAAIEICRFAMGSSVTGAALGGAPITPEAAFAHGWLDEVVAPEDLLDVAVARARGLGELAPDVYAFTKQQVHRPARTAIASGAAEDAQVAESWRSSETRGRIAEFVAELRGASGRKD